MPPKEFQGNLKKIAAQRIVKENREDNVADFFLSLAVIFNDLKGLIHFDHLTVQDYRQPELTEVTAHTGEYGGLRIQIYKLLIAAINEFFEFIKENQNILNTGEFTLILKALPQERRDQWNAMVDIATGKTPAASNFTKTLLLARNNVAFHYYQSAKNLRKGFISKFFKKENNNINKNEFAYFSIGENMEQTRFYYADAATEEYLALNAGIKELPTKEDYQKQIGNIIHDMNVTIALLLKEHLRARPH